jgi:hypothetical protein
MNWENITIDRLVRAYNNKNYKLTYGIYQSNIFGIRANSGATNKFDDIIGILRMNNGGVRETLLCNATTDPGIYFLENPMNVKGTAILIPGQYLCSHKVGLHKGNYRALVQCGKLRVWRDNDKDGEYDQTMPQDSNNDGINIHHAGIDSSIINKWSAGCQVVAKISEFDSFMSQIDDHLYNKWSEFFDYTLFEQSDVLEK